ncbi:MAG: GDP-mannose 4,6-dehydratase [Pseudomonadales bacterium]|nr:GDP-mannose 4,6-dehydratase [Candidatus Woesebacteria bacterium]MCB9802175.1 GDP-mannose 4,6-dehydratase [Pseudomonadales bacterium]
MQSQNWFHNKTVVVTGAAGFIGSHLCETLLHNEARVIGVDNFITGSRQNLSGFETHEHFTFLEADVSGPAEKYLADMEQLDAVLHFASPASPPLYQAEPVATYLANSIGTHHLLSFLKEHHPQARFLFASTSEVYGDPQQHPQAETYWGNVNPNGERSCYDESKRLGETICGVFARDLGIDARVVRIFNTYGPRIDLDDGRIIPSFIKQALAEKPFTIYGDGSQTRSYCYVDDLVHGILLFLAKEDLAGETINLGNPDEHTVLETAQIMHAVATGRETSLEDLPLLHQTLPSDDPTRRQPDIIKARQLLGWEPTISFEEGLGRTLKYYQSR